jgi:two-component system, cell cycle response regulator
MRSVINPQDFLILVVDDIPTNLRVVRGILEPIGYQLTFATNGRQTLERIETTKPDLILLDVMMPELSGLEVCEIIYSNPLYQDIPIIFLTAHYEKDFVIRAFEQGAVDYITKPFQKLELLARIKTHLELKQYRDRLKRQVQQERLMTEITVQRLRYPCGTANPLFNSVMPILYVPD